MTNGMKLVLLGAELLTIVAACIATFHPNVLYGAIALLISFVGVATMYLFAGADFLAAAQVIVYVGGVTILILFAIMLTQWLYQMKLRDVGTKLLVPVIIGVGLFVILCKSLVDINPQFLAEHAEQAQKFLNSPKTAMIGEALLNGYLLPFEAITILLLGALVGAVWIARPT